MDCSDVKRRRAIPRERKVAAAVRRVPSYGHVAVTCANRVASQRGYSTTRPYLAITMTCPLIEG